MNLSRWVYAYQKPDVIETMTLFKVPALTHPIFSTQLNVRIQDINYGRHLGHDSLISLLHEARIQFLESMEYTELNIEGLAILVTNLYVNYLKEAFYGDLLKIDIGIFKQSRTSMELLYNVRNHNDISIARALTSITFFDPIKRTVAAIPPQFLHRLRQIQNRKSE